MTPDPAQVDVAELRATEACSCAQSGPPFDWSCPSHGQEAVDEWTALREKRCVFCLIIAGDSPATLVEDGEHHLAFVPLGPHVPGHVVFVPRNHLPDATTNPPGTGVVFEAASRYVRTLGIQANIITSVGPQATQSVPHLHVHVVPRWPGDGLPRRWPWITAARNALPALLDEVEGLRAMKARVEALAQRWLDGCDGVAVDAEGEHLCYGQRLRAALETP